MFRPEEILSRLQQRPFRPFTIVASEGLRYEIRHPDLVHVSPRDLLILFAHPTRPGLFNREARVALIHVVALEEEPIESVQS
jgi:hypothetical protein